MVAYKLLLSCVGEIVSIQIIWPRESRLTGRRQIASLLCGRACDCSSDLMYKSLVTLDAVKCLLSCVGEIMFLQVTWRNESLITLNARKRLLSYVGDLLSIQVTWEKALLHWFQRNAFGICHLAFDPRKVWSHWLQENCFSPVWFTCKFGITYEHFSYSASAVGLVYWLILDCLKNPG